MDARSKTRKIPEDKTNLLAVSFPPPRIPRIETFESHGLQERSQVSEPYCICTDRCARKVSYYRARAEGRLRSAGKGINFFFARASLLAVVTDGAKNGQLPNERQLSGDQLQVGPVQRIKCNRPMSTVQHLCPFLLPSFLLSSICFSFFVFFFLFSTSALAAIAPLRYPRDLR